MTTEIIRTKKLIRLVKELKSLNTEEYVVLIMSIQLARGLE